VLAFKWSRMSRDAWEGMEIMSRSRRAGCEWKFVHSMVPPGMENSPMAVVFQALEGGQSEGERKSTKVQTDRGLEERTKRGGRRSSPKPP
jgi:hypothetical protein